MALRVELCFRLIGYVLMPEHFHLLIWPSDLSDPSGILQRLKGRAARFVLKALGQNETHAWCEKMLAGFKLPPTVYSPATRRVWQRRF